MSIFGSIGTLSTPNKKVALIVFLLNMLVIGYFWSVLGKNYTPVNDGWVNVSSFNTPDSRDKIRFPKWSNARAVRGIPFILAAKFEGNGFTPINLFLVTINIFTGLGIFLVLDRFFPQKVLFTSISSLLIMFYPYDGTMFWLGAFGVNLGYLLCIYSLYYVIRSIDDFSNYKFWVAILLLLASGRTYPGYLPFQLLVFILYLFLIKGSWKAWWPKAALFIAVWGVGFVNFALNASSGHGREGKVVNFELSEVLKGFGHAFQQLYVGVHAKLWEIQPAQLEPMAIVVVLLVAGALYAFARTTVTESSILTVGKEYQKIILSLTVIAPLILIVGYFPYAVSDVRYGTDRQFLFARPGVVLFFVAILFWFLFSVVKRKRVTEILLVVLSSLLIGLSINAKTKIAHEYAIGSQVERIFLGDIAELMPRIEKNPYLLVYFENNDVIVNRKVLMLLNRPQYLFGYLYEQRGLDVVGANRFLLKRYNIKVHDNMVQIKGQNIPMERLLVIGYSLARGARILDQLKIPVGKKREEVVQLFKQEIQPMPLTSRQQWFVDERDRLVKSLALREPISH